MNRASFPLRIRPDKGMVIKEHYPTLVFATICTKGRKPWLATDENHQLLRTIWAESTFWKVEPYIIMPNHLHFFAWPGRLDGDIDDWVQYWKSVFTRRLGKTDRRWQRASFHHRVRSDESAEKRRAHMCENPVRAGLVARACDWPYGARCSKRVFGGSAWGNSRRLRRGAILTALGNATPVTRERDPTGFG
jgi:putative transposase